MSESSSRPLRVCAHRHECVQVQVYAWGAVCIVCVCARDACACMHMWARACTCVHCKHSLF